MILMIMIFDNDTVNFFSPEFSQCKPFREFLNFGNVLFSATVEMTSLSIYVDNRAEHIFSDGLKSNISKH